MTAKHKSPEYLAKIISYILGRNPAEFGLVPDPEGFVTIKEFLKVVSEEKGLKHVRRSSIDEILVTVPNPMIEIRGNHIRSKEFQTSSGYLPARDIPKLLFTCVRRKAYSFVVEKGIFPLGFSHIILSSNPDMAERIGRRRDPEPVRLVVQTQKCVDKGTVFYKSGETLYLAESIPPGCFTGPPLPKQKAPLTKSEIRRPFAGKDGLQEPAPDRMPGSFILEFKDNIAYGTSFQKINTAKSGAREKASKKIKKPKRKRERPPWRQ
jgi:putative RNA 2'-phosphotransferase